MMTEMNNKIIQFNDSSFKEQRQVYVNMGSRIYREVDIYYPRLPHVWHSRKRKNNTKIELMDENEEMWDDEDEFLRLGTSNVMIYQKHLKIFYFSILVWPIMMRDEAIYNLQFLKQMMKIQSIIL